MDADTRVLDEWFLCGQSGDEEGTEWAYFQRIADSAAWQSGMAKDMGLAARLEEWTRDEMKKEGWVG